MGQGLQGHRHLERAGNREVVDIALGHTEHQQLLLAGLGQRVGNVGVKARLHQRNAQAFALKALVLRVDIAFVCTKHGFLSFLNNF